MIRRTLRWLLRMIVILIVLGVISHIVNWWSHRIAPGSVIELSLKGSIIERGSDGLRGLVDEDQTPLNEARRVLREGASDPRIVGLAISIMQAVTQLQDQTLSFVPKIIAMALAALPTLTSSSKLPRW